MSPSPSTDRILWSNVVVASLLMIATLPGRTQGLGLITEPMLVDLKIGHIEYAKINLWATLIGSAFCLPAGLLLDRFGLRVVSTLVVLALSFVVWRMSAHAGGAMMLFVWVLLTRAFGQSALSVASITAVGKGSGPRTGLAMGVYSVLLTIFFGIAIELVGGNVLKMGWRAAWAQIALVLVIVAPVAILLLRDPARGAGATSRTLTGSSLAEALRTPVFWIFGGATALFGLVSSGMGLFNQAVIGESGFDPQTAYRFLVVTGVFMLVGQGICGWLTLRKPMPVLLGISMFLYSAGLGLLPALRTPFQLWTLAAIMGLAAGFITVIFFAVWGRAYGRAHLGRIQGAAQMLTVFASAVGPLVFAECHARAGSYAPLLYSLAVVVLVTGIIALCTTLPSPEEAPCPQSA
jgi:MFS family permease